MQRDLGAEKCIEKVLACRPRCGSPSDRPKRRSGLPKPPRRGKIKALLDEFLTVIESGRADVNDLIVAKGILSWCACLIDPKPQPCARGALAIMCFAFIRSENSLVREWGKLIGYFKAQNKKSLMRCRKRNNLYRAFRHNRKPTLCLSLGRQLAVVLEKLARRVVHFERHLVG
jgi:hypothetical protein